ncbi:hypothetical protein RC99_15695 [Pectobacterium carotovorum subsp. carotovorum]|nr:hypothetical protein RC99_15695 [Pectobacterium carotovorum subsp. carotovorum]
MQRGFIFTFPRDRLTAGTDTLTAYRFLPAYYQYGDPPQTFKRQKGKIAIFHAIFTRTAGVITYTQDKQALEPALAAGF